jgi:2-keto-4-pentenoate hydratase/2-oxohepta-3-ene-1,7-dioic acid hydratase in catechol pathway
LDHEEVARMKLATFRHDGHRAVGLVDANARQVTPLPDALGAAASDMTALIEQFSDLKSRLAGGGAALPLGEVTLEAPLPRPRRNIFCVGKNYYDHAHEFAKSGFDSSAKSAADAVPEVPIIFTKPPESVIATGETIRYPTGISSQVDYEVELAVVIGRQGRGIKRAEAKRHIFGYTIINDVTARDLQARHKQWLLGKSLDTFCPMGPWLVTADEIDDVGLQVRTWVNDELRQDANTRDLIFDVGTLIETISAGITLYPGDVIATGTPAGVGLGFSPPRFLKPGDRVRLAISGIGEIENRIGPA